MFFIIKGKFLRLLLVVALLFSAVTGIILLEGRERKAVSASLEFSHKPVLIIDAGHGGTDGGAVAADGTTESIIILSIASKLNSAAMLFGLRTLMTREAEQLDYPEEADSIAVKKRWDQNRRLELINSVSEACLISIHQNKYPDSRPFGPQVLFGRCEGAEELGIKCHELLNLSLCPSNRRLAVSAPDNIYLMKNAKCPSILVECGFISNLDDLSKLLDKSYQKKLAAVILAAYLDYLA